MEKNLGAGAVVEQKKQKQKQIIYCQGLICLQRNSKVFWVFSIVFEVGRGREGLRER